MEFLEFIAAKILDEDALLMARNRAGFSGQKVVMTNGCFDLLHPGHIAYLSEARSLGEMLIVAVNSDASVRRLKGEKRPIMDEQARAWMLAALLPVSAVVIFEEDTPERLIGKILPDILVKGGDWAVSAIVGADQVLANGGEVKSLPFREGYSTTNIIERVLERNKP